MQVAQLRQHEQGLARPLQLADHLEVRGISTCCTESHATAAARTLSPAWHTQQQLPAEHVACQQTEQAHSDEASLFVQLLQDFTLSSSGEHSCEFFHPAQPQPSGMEQLNVAAIVAQAQHLQGWCAQLELQLQAKDIGVSPVASPGGHV